MNTKIIYILVFCLGTLSACATKPTTGKPGQAKQKEINNAARPIKPRPDCMSELLAFSDSYSSLTLELQKNTFTETNLALLDNKNDVTQRIKLAMILSLPSSRLRDVNKAQILLQDLLRENNLNSSESALVSLLYEYTLENSKLIQKNRDDSKKLEATQTRYESIQQKYDALELKLNELKNIEKTMNDRDVTPGNKP